MTDRGLFPAPDEEPPVSVSPAAASLPRADAPLKCCAHCGGTAYFYTSDVGTNVGCELCDLTTYLYDTKDEARQAWNRRDGEDARIAEAVAKARREALEEAIELIARIESIRDE